jgi:Fe2+ or Zn2+ uptake regulation protein
MDIKKRLQDNNKRITKERIEIFSFLKTKHFFTYSDINEKFENISRSSIFRNLNLFTEI